MARPSAIALMLGHILVIAAGLPSAALACSLCAMPTPMTPLPAAIPDNTVVQDQPRVEILEDLSFARIAMTGQQGAIVVIDAASGRAQGDGGAVIIGGLEMSGRARILGAPGRLINVDLPHQVPMQARQGVRATLRDIRTNLPPTPRLGSDGTLTFSFGGTLVLPSSATGGDYKARLSISASYQ